MSDASSNPGWWERHRRWHNHIIVAGVLALTVVAVVAVVIGVLALIGSSEPVRLAVGEANRCRPCREAMGTPIEAGWLATGNVHWSGSEGNADVSVSVSGPRGEGYLVIEAIRSGGEWRFEELVLVIPRTEEQYVLWRDGQDVSPSGDSVAGAGLRTGRWVWTAEAVGASPGPWAQGHAAGVRHHWGATWVWFRGGAS